MKVICHIGHHKTGTTTLQAFLSENSLSLLKAGILYPWTESEGASNALARAIDASNPNGEPSFNIREPHNALAFRMLADALPKCKVPAHHPNLPPSRHMLMAVAKQITALKPSDVVLCSEVMSHFGKAAPGQIKRLRNVALAEAQNFTLWCTLRRPDQQLVSWHGQQVRFGQSPKPLSDPDGGLNLKWLHVDYRGVVAPWLEQIENCTLVLRPYAETMAVGGSVEDFIQRSGLKMPAKLRAAKTMNISMKPAVVSLLRLANAALPTEHAQKLAAEIRGITRFMKLPGSSEVEFLGLDARTRLAEHFQPIHDWLSATAGRDRFFADIEEMAVCRPVPEMAALQMLLDQLSDRQIRNAGTDEISTFLADLKKRGATI